MKCAIKNILIIALFLFGFYSLSYGQILGVADLVDQFKKSTDIQRQAIKEQYRYEIMDLAGVVQNAKEWDKFDERTDTQITYYRIITNPQKTNQGNTYTISIYYKNAAKIKDVNEGQEIKTTGALLNIADSLDTISVSFFADQLSDEDKIMFNTPIVED